MFSLISVTRTQFSVNENSKYTILFIIKGTQKFELYLIKTKTALHTVPSVAQWIFKIIQT